MKESVKKKVNRVKILDNSSFKGLKEFEELFSTKKESKKHRGSNLSNYAKGIFNFSYKKRLKKLKSFKIPDIISQEELEYEKEKNVK